MSVDMPQWCGACHPRTRRFDLGEREQRCPHCHPYWAFGHAAIDPARVPADRFAQEQAVRWLLYEVVSLRALPARELRRRVRAFFDKGWSTQDIVHALDFDPDGSPSRSVPLATDPPDLTQRRVLNLLLSWCDDKGAPLASRSQLSTARRDRQRQRQLADQRELAQIAARSVDPQGAVKSGARLIAAQAAARAKQFKLEGRKRESAAHVAHLASQQALETRLQQTLRRLDRFKFGVVSGNGEAAGAGERPGSAEAARPSARKAVA